MLPKANVESEQDGERQRTFFKQIFGGMDEEPPPEKPKRRKKKKLFDSIF